MIDASKSIEACAAYYGDEADAMKAYLVNGEKNALALGNRGPIAFDENGDLSSTIKEAYSKNGFYIFEGVLNNKRLRILKKT